MKLAYITLYFLLLTCGYKYAQEQVEFNMSLLFVEDAFVDIARKDAEASFKIWTNMYSNHIYDETNIKVNTSFEILEDVSRLGTLLDQKRVDLVNLPSYMYKMLGLNKNFEPIWSGARGSSKFDEYVIIINNVNKITQLEELKSKSIILMKEDIFNLSHIWLKVLLHENNLDKKENFFGSISEEQDELIVIYKVFFGEADAAIVTKNRLELANELNPQISKKIVPIIVSEPMLLTISLLNKTIDPLLKKTLLNIVENFRLNSRSGQILDLFKIAKIDRIYETDLESVNNLLERYSKVNPE